MRKIFALSTVLCALVVFASPFAGAGMKGKKGFKNKKQEESVEDQSLPSPEMIGAFSPKKANREHMKARGFMKSGLKPVYPDSAKCPEIDSPFASNFRYDGSRRSRRFYKGYHGGADISVPEGTPILAIADGTVVGSHKGKDIGGLGIILQHSPDDTGLPVWTYTEYKHLKKMPDLEPGRRVRMGEEIALAGKTGTVGGHYGAAGHSHLHLTTWYSDAGEYKQLKMFIPENGMWMDPLALFKGMPVETASIQQLDDSEKSVVIPYKTSNGQVIPENTRVVWPFACTPR